MTSEADCVASKANGQYRIGMKTRAISNEPLSVLLEEINKGQEVLLTSNDQPVAKVVPVNAGEILLRRPNREPGCLKGFWMADDFDAPLAEFKEYME